MYNLLFDTGIGPLTPTRSTAFLFTLNQWDFHCHKYHIASFPFSNRRSLEMPIFFSNKPVSSTEATLVFCDAYLQLNIWTVTSLPIFIKTFKSVQFIKPNDNQHFFCELPKVLGKKGRANAPRLTLRMPHLHRCSAKSVKGHPLVRKSVKNGYTFFILHTLLPFELEATWMP